LLLSLAENLLSTDVQLLRQQAARLKAPETPVVAEATPPHPPRGKRPELSVAITPPKNSVPAAAESSEQRLPRSLSPYRRAHERIPVDWPVEIETLVGRCPGRVQDVSIKGVRVCWKGRARIGDTVYIVLTDQPGQPSLPARAIRAIGETMGVEFISEKASAYMGELMRKLKLLPPG
jgi:hypothetical protein